MVGVANRDDAMKCLRVVREAVASGDWSKAERFLAKAKRLFPCPDVEQVERMVLEAKDASARGRPEGGTGSPSMPPQASARKASGTASVRQQGSGGASSSGKEAPKATAEQMAVVRRVMAAKDFYEVLDVKRDASTDDVKRAYRKVALKLHPDKNCARGAEDAFKQVSKAFSTLGDPQKRAYYDRTGYEDTSAAQAAASTHERAYTHEEIDPEEIFRMFFGGSAFGPTPFGRRYEYRQRQHGAPSPEEQRASATWSRLFQALPVIMLMLFTLLQSNPEPPWSLQRSKAYPHQVNSQRLDVPFFVKDGNTFSQDYPPQSRSRAALENQVEAQYREKLEHRCTLEQQEQRRLQRWGSRKQAAAMEKPACDELKRRYRRIHGYVGQGF